MLPAELARVDGLLGPVASPCPQNPGFNCGQPRRLTPVEFGGILLDHASHRAGLPNSHEQTRMPRIYTKVYRMTVDFRLLGAVEAQVDGRRLPIGPARQRCVLGALLADVNFRVPLDQLVDRVWADRPPSARSTLASYVSRLRNLFANTAGVVIERAAGAYALQADPLSVDLLRFRHWARQARATADPEGATVLFDRSLATWSGEPFGSLETPWINTLRDTLLAERLAVTLDRNDAALRTGRHGELLVELTAALAAHPLDERLAGQLMVAQYRCGRQTDALGTYRQMRRRLVEELGLDPGPALQQIHHQILVGNPEQGHPAQATAGSPPGSTGSPHGFPGSPRGATVAPKFSRPHPGPHPALARRKTSFVSREQEVAQAVTALGEGPLVTPAGVAGVGKSRLALEIARGQAERFGDGVDICELAPLENGEAVGHAVAAALGLWLQHGPDVAHSVIEYLQAREVLLVIDNCEHVVEAAAQLVEQIVDHCPKVSVLATSRQPLGIEGERIITVPPLPLADALRLFADRARASRPDFDLDHQPVGAVTEICRRVDCLPLGVELAAARMRLMSSLDLVRRLDQVHLMRGGVRGVLPRQQSLTSAIAWSYGLLTPSEQALFIRLSVFAGSLDLEAAHGVCGADGDCEDDTLELLAGLVHKSMVMVHSVTDRTRYGVLETLRAFGRGRLREHGTDTCYAMRHAAYYAELAERAAAGLQGVDERDWVERMLPDNDNLRTAFEHAMANDDIDLALRLVTASAALVSERIGPDKVTGWAERVVAVADPNHRLFAAAVGTAARGAWLSGDLSRLRALAAVANGRVPGPGSARLSYPGDVLVDLAVLGGAAERGAVYWEREAARARRDGDQIRLVWTAFWSAMCNVALGVPGTALRNAQEAVHVADATGNPTARTVAYVGLGHVLKKSQPARALTLFAEAARLAETVQNSWWRGIALLEAASTRTMHGDPATAAQMFLEVLDDWDRQGDWTRQWISLRYITRMLVRLGADDDALMLHCAVIKAGKPAPLREARLRVLLERPGTERCDELSSPTELGITAAIARGRSNLRSYAQRAAQPAL